MAIRWGFVAFRAPRNNIRALDDIRRGKLWPYTLISQYDNSPRLRALLDGEETQQSPVLDIQRFFRAVFDPRTATGWGLDCWGRIVGMDRQLELKGINEVFGFDRSELMPFGQGTFWNEIATSTYRLEDEAFRTLIFFKAAINISDGTLASLNRLLSSLYAARGTVCVLHVGTMKLRFFFDFYLQPFERALATREDIPPKPAGVGFDIYEARRADTFGFQGSDLQPFNRGNFVTGGPRDAYSL